MWYHSIVTLRLNGAETMIDSKQTTCKACGSPLTQQSGRGHRKRLYCDEACRQRAYRERSEQTQEQAQALRIVELEQEVQRLQRQLDIEQRFRTDHEVRHFQSWLRRQLLPQDTDFFKRFLADTRIPRQASRAMYEARLRQYGYSAEDLDLFQSAWKDMLFQS